MREWSLGAGDPLSLTLGADMRLCTPDYLDDHIWELELSGGEPPSLAVRTTYGLRARSMRLFFRFAEAGKTIIDPGSFPSAPRVRRFYPNLLVVDFVPFEGLEITSEYWVPESHVLAGHLTFSNRSALPRHIDFELCGALTPLEGSALGLGKQQMVNILAGRTGGLEPVVFMTGGATHSPGPHRALSLGLDFDAQQTRSVNWACAAETTAHESFAAARRTAARGWEAERARIELLDAREVLDIHTGDPDWDAALAFSQKTALGLFYPRSKQLPNPSFVRTRQPDGGFSSAGDGSDYAPSWSGQSPLDTYYLTGVLQAAPQLTRGLVENFLSVQAEDGSIDGRPGLSGQRSKLMAMPILAALAWNHYQQTRDEVFLARVFPPLLAFFHAWLSPAHDPDGDGIPAWDHLLQTGFEDHPHFDVWYPWSQALNISMLFNPQLEALLHREATSLMRMAGELGATQELDGLRQVASRLSASIAASWNAGTSLYTYRDRRTGDCWPGRSLGSRRSSGEMRPKTAVFEKPVRLLIQVQTSNPGTKRPAVKILGLTNTNHASDTGTAAEADEGSLPVQPEHILEHEFQWHSGGLVATSHNVYTRVESITIEGLAEKDRLVVRTVDTTAEDITLFMPLWAHVPEPDQAQAMVSRLVQGEAGFNRAFGIPALPASPAVARLGTREAAEADLVAMGIHLPWNLLIGEAMLAYGFRVEAARLVTRLMGAVVHSLKNSRAFYERYHAGTGRGLGERGALTGLAPVGLFLQTLGVQILSPTSVRLEGRNPFPWPVTISHRGLRVLRGLEATDVTFPDEQVVTITDPAACTVSQ